jgi:hypothetical protein
MTERLERRINDSATMRWAALAIVAVTMMLGYFVAKEMSSIEDLLELPVSQGGLGWTSSEYGFFAGSRSFFNVFCFMLFIGGIILDKMGVRFTGLLACLLMVAGVSINYYAIEFMSPEPTTYVNLPVIGSSVGLGHAWIKRQVLMAAFGFAVFGVGYEMCGITVSKVMVKWFTGFEMALAMGIQVALARFGTGAALLCSHPLAQRYSISTPVLCGLIFVSLGLLVYIVYCFMDVKFDRQVQSSPARTATTSEDEKFHFGDLVVTLKNPGFWLITILCLLYYSALYPFLDFATKIMIYKYGVDPSWAGAIPSILPFSTILFTPLFGMVYDKKGTRRHAHDTGDHNNDSSDICFHIAHHVEHSCHRAHGSAGHGIFLAAQRNVAVGAQDYPHEGPGHRLLYYFLYSEHWADSCALCLWGALTRITL